MISNIITTNKNRTAIALTYTIINSHSNSNNIPEDAIKLKTKHITECTEFCKIMTDNELINKTIEKNKKMILEFMY